MSKVASCRQVIPRSRIHSGNRQNLLPNTPNFLHPRQILHQRRNSMPQKGHFHIKRPHQHPLHHLPRPYQVLKSMISRDLLHYQRPITYTRQESPVKYRRQFRIILQTHLVVLSLLLLGEMWMLRYFRPLFQRRAANLIFSPPILL